MNRSGYPRAPGPVLLVVEDEDLVRRFVCRMLEAGGYRIRQARDGLQALEVLAEGELISLVMSDIRMPNMNGWALSAHLATHEPPIPVLLMSGFDDDPEDGTPELPRLDKPFGQDQLFEAVRRLLRTSERITRTRENA